MAMDRRHHLRGCLGGLAAPYSLIAYEFEALLREILG